MSEPHPLAIPAPSPMQQPRALELLLLIFGVVLPLVTLGVELTTRMNREVFFGPLPSVFHALLVALVPAANLAVWLAVRSQHAAHVRTLALANGCAIGVALFYTLLFLPLLPLAAIAIIYGGLGLLPLTPLISLIICVGLGAGK